MPGKIIDRIAKCAVLYNSLRRDKGAKNLALGQGMTRIRPGIFPRNCPSCPKKVKVKFGHKVKFLFRLGAQGFEVWSRF